jgi:GDP-L-fucose synthase
MVPPRTPPIGRRRVVVCGATGFIGRNVAENLAASDQFDVVGLYHVRPPFQHRAITWRQIDLRDPDQVEQALDDAEVVIQAAAVTSGADDIVRRPHIHISDNAVMNSHLLRAAFERKVAHFVFFSCSIMYPSSERPQKEDDIDAGGSIAPHYFGAAWTKIYIERMCEFYARQCDTRFTVIRHSNIYGPHDKFDLSRSHVFGATVTKVMMAEDDRIVVWGAGQECRDLLYVSDLVDFVRLALDRQTEPFGLYNVGAGRAVSVRSLVEAIVSASGRKLRIEHDLGQPTIPTTVSLDCMRAREGLGWKPKVPLAEGISRTLDWYRAAYGAAGAVRMAAR